VAVKPTNSAVILAGAFVLGMAACAGARAATPVDPFSQHDDFAPQPNQLGPQGPHQSLQWDARKGRWDLNFDLNQPVNRSADWRDAHIGFAYRVLPGLRTGVGVTLGSEPAPDTRSFAPEEPAPRVRLETTFKF
jgi:hypothetical protein